VAWTSKLVHACLVWSGCWEVQGQTRFALLSRLPFASLVRYIRGGDTGRLAASGTQLVVILDKDGPSLRGGDDEGAGFAIQVAICGG
jgi:hypothetical protein